MEYFALNLDTVTDVSKLECKSINENVNTSWKLMLRFRSVEGHLSIKEHNSTL